MADPVEYDDPGPIGPQPPSRVRRWLTVALLIVLIVSMISLAFVSGRGVVPIEPVVPPTPTAQTAAAHTPMLAVVDGNGRLTTTDAVGGSVVTYGRSGIRFSFPAWSPDGRHIAVIGQDGDETTVYVFATVAAGAAATDPVIVYSSAYRPPFYLYWAPDGRQLSFLTTEPNGLALQVAPADGSSAAIPISTGSPMYWAWADAARMLVHTGGEGAGAFFGEIGMDGISVEPAPIEAGGFRAPAVSGNGRFRAYVTPGDGIQQRVVVESHDRASRHAVAVFGAAAIEFGPTTDDLAFIAPIQAGRAVTLPVGPLRLIDAASGVVRTIVAGSVIAFFWAPNGRTIATLQLAAPGDDKVAAAGRVILAATAPGLALRLVFVDVASGAIRSQRAVRVSDTFAQRQLPYFDQYALSHEIWSADSRSIALPLVADDGTSQVVVITSDGSGARRVADGVSGSWSP